MLKVDEDHEIFDDTDFFKQYQQDYLESTLSAGDQFLALSNSYATKRIKEKKKWYNKSN